jgi:cytochrome P450
LLTSVATRGRIELVREYALPLPTAIIAELLGIPHSDRQKFHRWSSRMVSISQPRDALLALPAAWMFLRYLRRLFGWRRTHPGDDLLSALLQVQEAGDRLSTDELLGMAVLLLIAGHETTVNLIAGGTLALLEHPDELERLRVNPTLIGTAVEELLRYTTPVEIASERYAAEDVELYGQTMRRGELVLAVLGSANRDSSRFDAPDNVDIARSPNHHLAFGQGMHYCLGAPLARLESEIAIAALFRRLPGVRLLSPASLRWRRGLFLRGLERLPLVTESGMAQPERSAA